VPSARNSKDRVGLIAVDRLATYIQCIHGMGKPCDSTNLQVGQ
jgi:hypothetical protein